MTQLGPDARRSSSATRTSVARRKADVADLTIRVAARLVERKMTARLLDANDAPPMRPLTAARIGIATTHRVMLSVTAERALTNSALARFGWILLSDGRDSIDP